MNRNFNYRDKSANSIWFFYGFKIGKRFAEHSFIIINGLAKGIDTLALEGALGAGGKVLSVLGSSLLNPYPKENLGLFEKLNNNQKEFSFLSNYQTVN